MKSIILCAVLLMLTACAGVSGSGNSEVYGQISGGVEHTHISK